MKRAHCHEFVFDKEAELAAQLPLGFDQQVQARPEVSWRDLWNDKLTKNNLWASCLLYSEASFNFFLLTFYLKYFPGNLFENSVYFACSDLMAYLLAGLFFNFASIKTGIRFGATLACAGGLMYLFMS